LHRSSDKNDSCRVSLAYLKSKEHAPKLICELCGVVGADNNSGELLVFQRFCAGKEQLATVHENCIRHTTIIDVGENDASRLQCDFLNVFSAIEQAQPCSLCGRNGATISCSTSSCGRCYHYLCAEKSAWKFNKQGTRFSCLEHRANSLDVNSVTRETSDTKMPESRDYGPREVILIDNDDDGSELLQYDEDDSNGLEVSTLPADIPLAILSSISKLEGNRRGVVRLGRLCRETIRHPWNVNLYATCAEGSVARVLKVATSIPDPFDQLEDGDVVQAINGQQVGSPELDSLQKVFTFLSQEVEAMVEVRRFHRAPGQWF
jgi:PHD-like zinc-binding domain